MKYITHAALFLAFGLSATSHAFAQCDLVNDDFLEDNDICTNATPLTTTTYPTLAAVAGDADWYSVTVAPMETASFQVLSLSTDFVFVNVYLDCNGALLFPGSAGDFSLSVDNPDMSPFTFYLQIAPGSPAGACYSLEATVPGSIVVSDFEDFCDAGDTADTGCGQCPCGNQPTGNTEPVGCLNSTGQAARLGGSGSASVANDTLRFEMIGATSSTFGVLVSGANALPQQGPCAPGTGILSTTLDGLRCVGGDLVRHGSRATDASGNVGVGNNGWGAADGTPGNILAQGAFAAGQERNFQAFYRESDSLACTTGQNTTNGVRVTVAP